MRSATSLIAMALATWGASVRAQAIGRAPPPFPAWQPSFHIRSFSSASMSGPLFHPGTLPATVHTCPMPVAHTDSAKQDPMPVARGAGTPVPMPVAKAGCSNPLDRLR